MPDAIKIISWGLYLPSKKVRGRDVAGLMELPPEIVENKIGFKAKHVPAHDDGCAVMAARASRTALRRAKLRAGDIDLVLFCGSEYKEHIVWSAASHIANRIGAGRALCFEVYALCAGLPIALKVAQDMMACNRSLRRVVVATASREGDLIDYGNPRTKWMSNFGAGAGAIVLGRSRGRGRLAGFSAMTDCRLSLSVVQHAGGTMMPASHETVEKNLHILDVKDMEKMRSILEKVSLPNYIRTIREALRLSGCSVRDISLLCITLMKPSFHGQLLETLRLDPKRVVYLDTVGHMQSVDQIAALEIASKKGMLKKGGVIVFAAAGTGYTWSAIVIKM